MEYPYVKQVTRVYLPLAPVQLQIGQRWFYCMAYLDSGASASVFQMKVAKTLGLSRSAGQKRFITVGDGDQMTVVYYRLKVRFSGLAFWAEVGFSETLGTGFNIIGRASFFERFRICFNERDKVVTTLRLF